MLNNILPTKISLALDKIPYNSLCELRLRADSPTVVSIRGENYYLSPESLSKSSSEAVKTSISELQAILNRISNNSMYTINDQLIEGFVSLSGGIRVGVCGETVSVDGKLKTLKNISSLNFRFPHFLKNCSLNIYPYVVSGNQVKSTLIISSPGAGKTTYLRDLIYQISNRENLLNLLIVDERCEIANIFDGNDFRKLDNVDIYSNCSKEFGFTNGIRSMKPDVVFTDEINIEKDMDIIENALTSGVKVIATLHAGSIKDIKNKPSFENIVKKCLFERYIVLSNADGVGTVEGIYNENLNLIGV